MTCLATMLHDLQVRGCHPCISLRGDVWRAHINACGKHWEEARTPEEALELAMDKWVAKGCPMDGLAENIEEEDLNAGAIDRLFALIFLEAFRRRGREINIFDTEDECRVEYLIDGKWIPADRGLLNIPKYLSAKVIGRLLDKAHIRDGRNSGTFEIGSMGRDLFLFVYVLEDDLSHIHISVYDQSDLVHVYFGSLSLDAHFIHKHLGYVKIGDAHAVRTKDDAAAVFEPHYGCFITHSQFETYKLDEKAIRDY